MYAVLRTLLLIGACCFVTAHADSVNELPQPDEQWIVVSAAPSDCPLFTNRLVAVERVFPDQPLVIKDVALGPVSGMSRAQILSLVQSHTQMLPGFKADSFDVMIYYGLPPREVQRLLWQLNTQLANHCPRAPMPVSPATASPVIRIDSPGETPRSPFFYQGDAPPDISVDHVTDAG